MLSNTQIMRICYETKRYKWKCLLALDRVTPHLNGCNSIASKRHQTLSHLGEEPGKGRSPYKNRHGKRVAYNYFNYNTAYMQIPHKRDIAANCTQKQIHLLHMCSLCVYCRLCGKLHVINLHIIALCAKCVHYAHVQ